MSSVKAATVGSIETSFRRGMSSGAERLQYNVYLDETRTRIWGDGSGGTDYYVKLNPVLEGLNMYGRIMPRQSVRAGTYTDSLKVTILY